MSTFKEKLSEQMKSAMKSGQKDLLTCARNLHAAIRKKEVDERIEVQDEDFLKIVSSLVKKQQEAIEEFQKAGREDLLPKEKFELDFLKTFLPTQLGSEELKKMVGAAIEQTQAKTLKDIPSVMKVLLPQIENRADPKLVGQWIREQLSQVS